MREQHYHSRIRSALTLANLCACLFVLTLVVQSQAADQGVPRVIMQTNMGNIEIELNSEQAPQHSKKLSRIC